MPVYEETYRGWAGTLTPRPRTWWIIARTGVRLQWRKGMIFLLLISILPFVVRAFQIYASTRGDARRCLTWSATSRPRGV